MLQRLGELLFLFAIIGVALYFVSLNESEITIHFYRDFVISGSAGTVILSAIGFGILITAIVATFFGIKAYFRERRLKSLDKQRQAFYEGMLVARAASASDDNERAIRLWQQIIKKDPTDIIARVELSKALEKDGEALEALQVIDAARATAPENVEVLFRAATLNYALNNRTAAIDNLALVLYHSPNRHAAKLARDISEELGRIEDAVEYNNRLQAIEGYSEDVVSAEGRLQCKKVLRDFTNNPEKLIEELRLCVKKYPEVPLTHIKLADALLKESSKDEAAQHLSRAAKHTQNPDFLYRARTIWLDIHMQDKALAAAKSARTYTHGKDRIYSELELVKTYLMLQMESDARQLLDNLPTLVRSENIKDVTEFKREIAILKGIIFYRSHDLRETAALWKELEVLSLGSKSYFTKKEVDEVESVENESSTELIQRIN